MSNSISLADTSDQPKLALIAGPTASGKSELAVRLAFQLGQSGRDAVVINADSAQVYRDLTVLSARPTEAEMRGVPHRLFGTWDGSVACSAADWAAAAKAEIDAAHHAAAIPILVGGTGLYIRTLLDGIAPVPPIDPSIRAEVRSLSPADLGEMLRREDPAAASRIAAADRTRLARALEVVRSTGRPLSEWQCQRAGGIAQSVDLHPLILLPERDALYARCDARFGDMIERGAAEEVIALLERGLDPALPVMRAIGVREIAAWLDGSIGRDEAVSRGQQATRNYAKRQYTWLAHQPPAHWMRLSPQSCDITGQFASLFRI
jgi:tRNA dimethylallyltransferase